MAKRVWLSTSSSGPSGPNDKVFGAAEFTMLATALVFGAPALLVGFDLLDAVDGLGLTMSQLVLVAPLGIVFAAVLVAATVWAAADTGVPFGLLQRPALGFGGGVISSAMVGALLIAWIGVELDFAARALASGLEDLGLVSIGSEVLIGILVVAAGLFMIAGLNWVVAVWMYRFAFWAALGLLVLVAWTLLSGVELGPLFEATPSASRFWLGVDAVVMLGVLAAVVLADSGRFVASPSAAASAGGTGVAVVGLVLVMLGGIRAATVSGLFDGQAESLVGGLSSFGTVVVVLWVLVIAVDQPFLLGFSAATSFSAIADRLAGRIQAIALVVFGGLGALFLDSTTLRGLISLLSVILAVLVAVVLADFFVVRRRYYETDQLYSARGVYGVFNWFGVAALLVGCIAALLLEPVGPPAVVDWLDSFLPNRPTLAESTGMPPRMIAMVVGFATYALLGRWKIHDRVVMSRLRV